MSRYRSEGPEVYQGETVICICMVGDQGQKPEAIAERIAALMNADFERFCRSLCLPATEVTATSLTHGRTTVRPRG